jgi:SAM-dependent methyltransferase
VSSAETRAEWDAAAATFDDEPDHGLRDPAVRRAWRALLTEAFPEAPARVADLGCGTGSLSVLLAEDGHLVHGVDLSDAMIYRARAKAAAAGVRAVFTQGDAAEPGLEQGGFDVVLSRHVLWALPDPAAALARWVVLLAPGGRLVLVEGRWFTGAGLDAATCERLVRDQGRDCEVRMLPDPEYWGGPVDDERFLLVSRG